jgi:anti-sigma factor RsiW
MSDRYSERLSEYLDGELSEPERSDTERHLRTCAACSATVDDLRRVIARAGTMAEADALADAAVARDLWPGIEARIKPARLERAGWGRSGSLERRRFSFSMPQLIAACLATAVLTGALVWYLRSAGPRQPGELIPGSASTAAVQPAASNPGASSAAVEDLRRALANQRNDLDPETVRTLEQSLMIIEVAIREGQRALAADPRNPYIRAHLDDTMRRKVELLHRATMLASATR